MMVSSGGHWATAIDGIPVCGLIARGGLRCWIGCMDDEKNMSHKLELILDEVKAAVKATNNDVAALDHRVTRLEAA